jgi:hypothetical protein
LGEQVYAEVVEEYDEAVAQKDPEFYAQDHTELRTAWLKWREGKNMPLSQAAQTRLIRHVRQFYHHEIRAVREGARRWISQNTAS